MGHRKHTPSRSRGSMCPRLAIEFPQPSGQRAQGMPGARCTRGLVCQKVRIRRTRAYRAAETLRHPLRNGFTAYFVLSPVSEFWFVTVVCGTLPANLAPATGVRTTRLGRTLRRFRPTQKAPDAEASITVPALRIVTIAKRPSCGPGWRNRCQ